ncbi:MAG: SPOR domain-containing protein [Massilia sp.]
MTAHFRSPSPQRQRGNTLTGLIIGLIVGLAIAVAVALSITKGASPFTDRGPKAGRPADPAPGQAADPNKPMYGNREPAREANRELVEKTAPKAAPAAPAAAAPAADPDPLGKAIAGMKDVADTPARRPSPAAVPANTAAPAPAPAVGGDGYVYYLQAGAFREMSDAEATRAKLALLGFEAAISDRSSDSGVLHRVRMGPYHQVEAMNKARAKLLDSGIDVAIVRNQK